MLNISLEKSDDTIIAFVSDEETGISSSVSGKNLVEAIQAALDWGMRDVSLSYVYTVGSDLPDDLW